MEGKWEEGESQAEERVAGRDQYELNLNIFCTGVSPVILSRGTTTSLFEIISPSIRPGVGSRAAEALPGKQRRRP